MHEAEIISFLTQVANDNHWVNPYSNEMGVILHNIRLLRGCHPLLVEQEARFEAGRAAKMRKAYDRRSRILAGIQGRGECGLIDN